MQKKFIEINENNDYSTGNLLDYEYFPKYNKLIAIDLTKQLELENPILKEQNNFIGKLEINKRATPFFIVEKLEETTFNCSQNSVTII